MYTPWEAPDYIQEKAGCIIGKDYPAPMVDHDSVVTSNGKVRTNICEGWNNKFDINISV